MSKAENSGSKAPKTRRQSLSRLIEVVGRGKEFLLSEVPTNNDSTWNSFKGKIAH